MGMLENAWNGIKSVPCAVWGTVEKATKGLVDLGGKIPIVGGAIKWTGDSLGNLYDAGKNKLKSLSMQPEMGKIGNLKKQAINLLKSFVLTLQKSLVKNAKDTGKNIAKQESKQMTQATKVIKSGKVANKEQAKSLDKMADSLGVDNLKGIGTKALNTKNKSIAKAVDTKAKEVQPLLGAGQGTNLGSKVPNQSLGR